MLAQNMKTSKNLEAALTYASWGWYVLPLLQDAKRPASEHGVKDATTDPEQITRWWAQNPNYNIGIAAGEKSRILVFDIDPRNGGDDSWAQWVAEHGAPHDGLLQLTAGGGQHHVMRYTPELKSCELIKGVDLLTDGKYFVVSPSTFNGRSYEWEASSDPFAGVAPAGVGVKWLDAYKAKIEAKGARLNNSPGISNTSMITGGRNNGLTAMGGAMRRYGMSEQEIMAALTVANDTRCNPSLPASELAQIVHSVSRYAPDTDIAVDTALGSEAADALLNPPVVAVIDKLKMVFGDQLGDDYEAPDELVEGLMTCGSSVVVYGDSNSGKTFWALSVATAIATGTDCYGRKTDPGLVVYLASEAPTSIRSRMQAIKKYHGCNLENLAMVPMPMNFYNGDNDAHDVIELVKAVELIRGKPVQLIIGDTLARMSAGANENSGEDMGPVMNRFDRVAHATGAAMMIIHHNGKDAAKGARGWSGIRAHIDTEIEVSEKDGARSVSVTKQRELPSKGETIYFKLEVVEMGISKFGGIATTCVAVPDNEASAATPHKKPSKHDENMRTAERAWWASGAEERNDSPYISRSALRDFLIQNGASERTARNKTDSSRPDGLVTQLLNAGVIEPIEHGWKFIDPVQVSAMMMKKKGG